MPISVRIGNQSTRHAPAGEPYQFALRHEFDAFEWFSDKARGGWGEDDVSAVERATLRETTQNRNIRFSVHAPFAADPMTQAGTEAILTSIRFAGDVGAAIVNVHLFPEYPSRTFAEALRPLLVAAAAANVRLSLENTPEVSPDHCNAVFGVLSALPGAAGRVGMCLDSGHANLHPATRNDFLRYVDLLGDHVPIIHWHAHENWGERDEHLPLFTGPSAQDDRGIRGLVRRLKSRGFDGSAVLEQWPSPPVVLVHTRERLRSLFEAE